MDSPIHKIKKWIISAHSNINDIDPNLDLIDNRLIDSLRFVDLVFLLEELSETVIEISNINIDQIRTLNAIEQTFFVKSTEVTNV